MWIQICVHKADTKEFDRFGQIFPNFVQSQILIGTDLTKFDLIRPILYRITPTQSNTTKFELICLNL